MGADEQCHDIFIQYGDLLSEQLSSKEHIDRTPDLESLVSEYGLDFAQAFQILRPKLNAEMDKYRAEEKAAMAAKLDAEKRSLDIKINSPSQPTTPLPSSPKIEALQVDGEDTEGSEDGSEPPTPTAALMSSVPLPRGKVSWPPLSKRCIEESLLSSLVSGGGPLLSISPCGKHISYSQAKYWVSSGKSYIRFTDYLQCR